MAARLTYSPLLATPLDAPSKYSYNPIRSPPMRLSGSAHRPASRAPAASSRDIAFSQHIPTPDMELLMQAFFNAVSNYADFHGLDVIFVRDQIGDKADKLGICAIFRFKDSVGPYQATLDQCDPIPGRQALPAKAAGPKNKARKAIPGREAEEPDEYVARVKAKISEAIRVSHKRRHGVRMISPPKPSRIDFRASV